MTEEQDTELSQALDVLWEKVVRDARIAWEADVRQKIAEISARLDALQRELDARKNDRPASRVTPAQPQERTT